MSITKVSGRIAGILGRPPSSASGVWSIDELNKYRPLAIPGLQLWLDASDASTLYDSTTGGALVAADGGVARWEDKSGNGRHATQSTSGSRPLRKANVRNGLDVMRFDGSDDFLSIPSSTSTFNFLHNATGGIVFLVYKATAAQGTAFLWCNNTNPSTGSISNYSGAYLRHDTTPDRLVAIVQGPSGVGVRLVRAGADNSAPSGSFAVISLQYDVAQASASDRHKAFRNGVDITGTNTFGLSESAGIHTGDASADLHIFANNGAQNVSAGDLCEIIVYSGVMSAANRVAVQSYLAAKWGI